MPHLTCSETTARPVVAVPSPAAVWKHTCQSRKPNWLTGFPDWQTSSHVLLHQTGRLVQLQHADASTASYNQR